MKKVIIFTLILVLALATVGCGQTNDQDETTQVADTGSDLFRFTIGTAGTAGSLYPMGVAMAQTITDHVDGLAATGEATAASIENLRNLHEGNMGMGISQTEVASFAYYGIGDYEGNAYTDIRAMFSTLYSYLQAFTLEGNGIETIADLEGKTVGVGNAGSGGEMAVRALLNVYGMTYDDINEQFMSEADAVAAIKDGKIDAFIATHPINSAPLQELRITSYNVCYTKLLRTTAKKDFN